MFKKILVVAVVLLVALVVFVSVQPTEYAYERSTTISAPASASFALVNDFHNWDRFSPWANRDPDQKTTYEGAAAGKGAIQKWSGNDEVGEGQMTITDSREDAHVAIDLEFIKPFASKAKTTFDFAPTADGATRVTWRMAGENDFMGKAMSLVMDMDAMIGKDFEAGLAAMKTAAEEDAKKAAAEAAKVAEAAAAQAEAGAAADAEGGDPEPDSETGLPADAVAAPAAP